MKIHEYQAKQLLRDAGVAVPQGIVATTADEAAAAFKQLGGPLAVVKAQIHAGGRGKGTIKDNPKQHGVQLVAAPTRPPRSPAICSATSSSRSKPAPKAKPSAACSSKPAARSPASCTSAS